MEFWCCLRNGPFQEIDAKYCIPYMSWFSFISDHSSFYFVICLKKTCGAPWPQFGAASWQASSGWQLARRLYSRLLEPKDRHHDIIDIEMILRRVKKHASLLMCPVFYRYFTTFPCLDTCYVYLIIFHNMTYESIAFAFLEQVRALEKREDAAKVLQIARDIKETLSLECLLWSRSKSWWIYTASRSLAYCNCCQEQIDAFQPYLPIAASLPSFSNVETFQCILAHSWY